LKRKTKRLPFVSWVIDSPYRIKNHLITMEREFKLNRNEFTSIVVAFLLTIVGLEWVVASIFQFNIKYLISGLFIIVFGIYLFDTSIYFDHKRK